MRFFHLEHPANELIFCDRDDCNGIADYLEVDENDTERRLCGAHTSSHKYASQLPQRTPKQAKYRTKDAGV